ncbi:hypothetical protein [Nocardioides montaniterrae]
MTLLRRTRIMVATAVIAAAATTPLIAPAHAVTDSPSQHYLDVSGVRVTNTARSVTFTFFYRQVFTPVNPNGQQPDGYPWWWGGDVFFDTDASHAGPEYGALINNQCGAGYELGRLVKRSYGGTTYYDVTDKWKGGCGDAHSCVHTADLTESSTGSKLTSIVFRKVKGCYTARRVRMSAFLRTGAVGWTSSDYSGAHDVIDAFPRSTMTQWTGWTGTGHRHFFADQTTGFQATASSEAP